MRFDGDHRHYDSYPHLQNDSQEERKRDPKFYLSNLYIYSQYYSYIRLIFYTPQIIANVSVHQINNTHFHLKVISIFL